MKNIILALEGYQQEKNRLEYGCNIFHEHKDNQSRPLSFWTDEDILEYIERFDVRIPKIYKMGYSRNSCMYCGFGVQFDPQGSNRYEKLRQTHPIQYRYFIENFGDLMIDFGIDIAWIICNYLVYNLIFSRNRFLHFSKKMR